MLPGLDGWALIERARDEGLMTPILAVSARGNEHDKVATLTLGADDYLAKPFGMAELHARVRAALRRTLTTEVDPGGALVIGPLRLDPDRRLVTVGDEELRLTPREYELLKVLLANAGRVVTSGRLLRAVWGSAYAQEGHYLHVYIAQIRRKLAAADPQGALADLFVAEPGVGYRVRGDS
jgi:two-component system, OmpR family, KDP operon response regulator KdpE